MIMRNQIVIHSNENMDDYFYTPKIYECLNKISNFLDETHKVHLFPEATIKTNKMPNGLLIKSPSKNTILMPFVLRDPGCGFLVFKMNQVSHAQLIDLSHSLLDFCASLEKSPSIKHQNLVEGIKKGVSHLPLKERFFNKSFPLELSKFFIDLSLEELAYDLSQITNTLEVRLMDQSFTASLHGKVNLLSWIHTGSAYFPHIILERWFSDAAEYSFSTGLANESAIKDGFCGLRNHTVEGERYKQWIFASMNYCLYKRWWLYSQIANFLKSKMKIETQLINDRCHAGLFKTRENGHEYDFQTRGVQILRGHRNKSCLIAGQKEGVAYFLEDTAEPLIGHGTSYAFDKSINYFQEVPKQYHIEPDYLISNVDFDVQKSIVYNYNIYKQGLNLRLRKNPIILYPLFNYHGRYLRN